MYRVEGEDGLQFGYRSVNDGFFHGKYLVHDVETIAWALLSIYTCLAVQSWRRPLPCTHAQLHSLSSKFFPRTLSRTLKLCFAPPVGAHNALVNDDGTVKTPLMLHRSFSKKGDKKRSVATDRS
jgi:hypothetical protein